MRCLTLGVLTLAAAQAATLAPASASDQHPWCVIVQDSGGGAACGYDTFAQCLVEARGGNTGYCAANPNFPAPAPAKPSRQRRRPG